MARNKQEQGTTHAAILPAFPLTLSILSLDNRVRTVRLKGAGVTDAGIMARELSQRYDVFVNILDEHSVRHGAFVKGEYIDSSTSEEQMIAIAEAWQRDHGYEPTTGEQHEKRAEIFIAKS